MVRFFFKEKHTSGLLMLLVLLQSTGCAGSYYNLATQREEWILYTSDKEVNMGRKISKRLEKELKVLEDVKAQKRVKDIGEKLTAYSTRQEILYEFKVLDLEEVNAISLPGGYVYINRGLLEEVESDDELASVIAHEIGHIAARHAMKRLQASMGYGLLQALAAHSGKASAKTIRGANIAFMHLFLAYARGDELAADRLAVRMMKQAGYDPHASVQFLNRLKEIHQKKPPKGNYLRTHPFISDRIRVVYEEIDGKLKFEHYINIEEDNIE